MRGALRLALAYFSAWNLQGWISLACAVLFGICLVLALLTHIPAFDTGAVILAIAGAFVTFIPAYSGGLMLRLASTPGIMHLRPHGRWQMFSGATIAVTITAAVQTLPAVLRPLSPLGVEFDSAYGLTPAVLFQFCWGMTALLWVATFALSSRQVLLIGLMPVQIGLMSLGLTPWNDAGAWLPFPKPQRATLAFAVGIAAWAIFALWYSKAPNVLRRSFAGLKGWSDNQAQLALDFEKFKPAYWLHRSPSANSKASRTRALSKYLTDMESPWGALGMGALVALIPVADQYLLHRQSDPLLLTFLLMMVAFYSATTAARCVRRARLLWLRAGQDRTALLATAEEHTLNAVAEFAVIPVLVAVAMAINQNPAITGAIILHSAALMAFAVCALYTGLTFTRGAPQLLGLLVLLGTPSLVALLKLDPHTVTSPQPQLAALVVFSLLAFLLRRLARRSWLRVDWRRTGPPAAARGFG